MSWQIEHLKYFEKPFELIPDESIKALNIKLLNFNHSKPLISIVVIAHNEENRIFSCLSSLSDNLSNYTSEIIVIDNASSDKTSEILDKINILKYKEDKKGPGYARNLGLDCAKGY